MDNNQQDATVVQPTTGPSVTSVTAPDGYSGQSVTNLGIHEPTTVTGNSVQSPLSGANVSMTTAQPYGGPIVTTEVPHVANETGPTR